VASKDAKKKGDADDGQPVVRLAAHPRAQAQISTAKSWGGLLGFVLVGMLSYRAGVPAFDAGLRALAGGIGMYLLAWLGAVAIWREIAVAEVERARRLLAAHAEAVAAAQAEADAERAS
jgi:predicted lipid-binding transport protein (Tim44 family)